MEKDGISIWLSEAGFSVRKIIFRANVGGGFPPTLTIYLNEMAGEAAGLNIIRIVYRGNSIELKPLDFAGTLIS